MTTYSGVVRITGPERFLNLMVAVIDEQEAATIEAEPLEAIDNTGKCINLSKNARDLVRK